MLLLALHRQYQRTCQDCRYHWTLTRREAQFYPRHSALVLRGTGRTRYGGATGALRAFNADFDAQLELAEQFRRCAMCSCERFTQRPVTKRRPPDPGAAIAGS